MNKSFLGRRFFLLVLFLSVVSLEGLSEGQLDTTYNSSGTKPGTETTMIGGAANSLACGVVAQSNGKFTAAGYATVSGQYVLGVARYLRNGTLDTTFNSSGTTPGTSTAVFGTDNARGYSIALQLDNKAVVVGRVYYEDTTYRFAVARFSTDGTLDTTFNLTGMVTTAVGTNDEAGAVAISGDKIVVAGTATVDGKMCIAVAQYTSAGTLDTENFGGGNGYVTTAIGTAHAGSQGLVIQSDGKIVVAGQGYFTGSTDNFIVARYTSAGVLDTTFNTSGTLPGVVETNITGIANNNYANDVKLQSDGKIIASGVAIMTAEDHYKMAVARYTTAGVLDTTFNASGDIPGTNVTFAGVAGAARGYGLAIQPDDKILVSGWGGAGLYCAHGIARFKANGVIDTTFNTSGDTPGSNAVSILSVNQEYGYGLALTPDNRVVVVGSSSTVADQFYFGVIRFIALPVEVPTAQHTIADTKAPLIGLNSAWVDKAAAFYALLRLKYYDFQ